MPFVPGSGFPQTGDNRTRANALIELAEYVGGENDPPTLLRCGRSWDAAVREFNSVPWKFNRLTQDISLSSTMLDNTAAPTVSRDAGTGAGFVVTTGTTIKYWVEERVKDGSYIRKRNNATAATVLTFTGDGSTDKPVVTRPATVNLDTTHWALFGTRAGGEFPIGAEIDEVAIATTTIEDTRTGNNPAIPTGNPYYVGSYLLETDFRNPKAAHLVNDEGQEASRVCYIPYDQFTREYMENEMSWSGTYPDHYTVRNSHQVGEVIVTPRQQRPTGYPTLRIIYHRRIALATGDSDRLNVPVEVEQAIFTLAAANTIAKLKKPSEFGSGAGTQYQLARRARLDVELEWRDFPEKYPM